MPIEPLIVLEYYGEPISIYKVGQTTFVKIYNPFTNAITLLVSTSKNRTLIPYKNGVKILPHPDEKVLNNFYIDFNRLDNNFGAANGADLINKLAEQEFFKAESGTSTKTWKAKTYLDALNIVEYNNSLYKLLAAIPFVSTNIDAEISAGSWVRLTKYPLTKVDVGLSQVDNTADINKPISNATQAALNTLTASQLGGIISFTTYALMLVYATPNVNAVYRVTNDVNTALNLDYHWVSGTTYEPNNAISLNLVTNDSLYLDGNTIQTNISDFEEQFTWHTGNSHTFSLSFEPTYLQNIYINSTRLFTDAQYSVTLPNLINILSALADGDIITIQYQHKNI